MLFGSLKHQPFNVWAPRLMYSLPPLHLSLSLSLVCRSVSTTTPVAVALQVVLQSECVCNHLCYRFNSVMPESRVCSPSVDCTQRLSTLFRHHSDVRPMCPVYTLSSYTVISFLSFIWFFFFAQVLIVHSLGNSMELLLMFYWSITHQIYFPT